MCTFQNEDRLVGYETCAKRKWRIFYRPLVAGELHRGKIIHHSDVDKLLGVSDHTEDGLQVRSPALRTQWRRRALCDRRTDSPLTSSILTQNSQRKLQPEQGTIQATKIPMTALKSYLTLLYSLLWLSRFYSGWGFSLTDR